VRVRHSVVEVQRNDLRFFKILQILYFRGGNGGGAIRLDALNHIEVVGFIEVNGDIGEGDVSTRYVVGDYSHKHYPHLYNTTLCLVASHVPVHAKTRMDVQEPAQLHVTIIPELVVEGVEEACTYAEKL